MYDVNYRSTKEHSNAYVLSRLPLPLDQSPLAHDEETVFNVGQMQAFPHTFQDIKSAMRCDPSLSEVLDCVKREWTKEVPEDVQLYIQHQNELSVENGCILLWGTRVVIPKSLQGILKQSLHKSHPWTGHMKALA